MKRVFSLLIAMLTLLVLIVPVSARTKDDLQKVYDNLTQYLYTPYFSDSAYFKDYETTLRDTKALLARDDATEDEIDALYKALKESYTTLIHDSFDYSLLDELASDYEKLSISLYEEDTWRRLSDVMDKIYLELDSPTLFKKGNSTKESYTKTVDDFIQGLYSEFVDAYNQLVLKPLPENINKDQLLSLMSYCNLSAEESLMKQSSYWNDYQEACNRVRTFQGEKTPDEEQMNEAASRLLTAYQKLSADCFDLSPIENEILRFQSLTPNTYTSASWASYAQQIKVLEAIRNEPQFLYLKNLPTSGGDTLSIRSFFEAKTEAATKAHDALVTQESINKLSALCNAYHYATASQGVEIKLKLLLECVDRGYQILGNENATPDEVALAIEEIENAAENLHLAEGYLSDEQKDNVKSDVETIQYILVFAVLTLILALICACVFSYRRFGRLNWHL